MSRFDDIGLFWEDIPEGRTPATKRDMNKVASHSIPETGWTPPTELPNIRNAEWIAIDCECWDPELIDNGPGWARGVGHIVGVSIAVPKQFGHNNGPSWENEPPVDKYYFPIRHKCQPELNLDAGKVLSWLKYSLSGDQPKIGANLIYDLGWLMHEGVPINGPVYDCQYAEGLIDEEGRMALEEIGWKYLHRGKTSDALEEWIMTAYSPPVKHWRREIHRSPVTLTGPYAEDDAAMPWWILRKQWPILAQRGLMPVFEMECKLIRLLIAMRFAGITVDLEYAEKLKEEFGSRANTLNGELKRLTGMEVAINSPDSLAKVFKKEGIPFNLTRTGKPSFKAAFLQSVNHPVAKLIVQERQLRKLIGTFIQGYILDSHINSKVYASFHPMASEFGGARSGRFSSSSPNLQNIPIRTPEGRLMRALFRYDYGHKQYRSGDFSQVEYRMLAHYAIGEGADDVRARYNNDNSLDYHELISQIINALTGYAVETKKGILAGRTFDGANNLIREHIKTLNFACVYAVGVQHLAEMLNMDLATGRSVSQTFHKAVPFVKPTANALIEEVGRTGICTTIMGRQSHFDLWEPPDYRQNPSFKFPLPYEQAVEEWGPNLQRAHLHATLNYRLQGSAADVMKATMLACWENGVFSYTGVPRLTCHDELGFSDPGGVPEDAWRHLVHTMENTIKLRVPLRFDFKAGNNWMECK